MARDEKLSERERLRLLRVVKEMMARPAARSSKLVDAEIKAIRAARRSGGRRSPADGPAGKSRI
jgi:hypothetical protein